MPPAKRYSWSPRFCVLSVLLFCIPLSAYADTKIITAEGTYTMGEGETPLVAELRALQQAKRTAVEQAGTYIQSYTKAKHFELTADEIETVSAGIIEVEVLEKNRQLVGKGLQVFVKIKATVTVEKADELVSRLRQKSPDDVLNRESEYKKLKDGYAQLETEIYTLKRQMAKSKDEQERQRTIRLIAEQERKYQARELYGRCQVSMMSIQFSGSDKPMAGYKAFVACLDEVIRLDPSFANAWGMRGIYREAIGQPEGSIDDYTVAIQLDRQSDRYLARGQAFERLNKLDQALMDADEAIRLDLNAANLYQWRGGLYYSKGSYSSALSDFTDAILFNSVTYSGDPALATIALAGHYADRGLTYGQLGQHQAAIDDFTKAAKLVDSPMVQSEYPLHFKKKKSLVLYDRAKSYGLLKRDDEALRDYRQACMLGNVLGCDALKGR